MKFILTCESFYLTTLIPDSFRNYFYVLSICTIIYEKLQASRIIKQRSSSYAKINSFFKSYLSGWTFRPSMGSKWTRPLPVLESAQTAFKLPVRLVSTRPLSAAPTLATTVSHALTRWAPPRLLCPVSVYVEFGAEAGDTITLTNTLGTGTYNWNILARQISCTSPWK